jgi:hypothetical protein
MSDITRSDVAIMEDHLMLFSEVRLSHSRARILFHQAASFTTFRTVLEQIAAGANSNADAAAWAKRVLADERADRPKVKRRSKPLVRLEGMP